MLDPALELLPSFAGKFSIGKTVVCRYEAVLLAFAVDLVTAMSATRVRIDLAGLAHVRAARRAGYERGRAGTDDQQASWVVPGWQGIR